MMREEGINEAEVKRGKRSLREAGLDQIQGPEKGGETGPGLGTGGETGAGETETGLLGETGVPGNTDQILLKGIAHIYSRLLQHFLLHSDDDWRSTPPNNTIMIRGLPLYVTEQHVRLLRLRLCA